MNGKLDGESDSEQSDQNAQEGSRQTAGDPWAEVASHQHPEREKDSLRPVNRSGDCEDRR